MDDTFTKSERETLKAIWRLTAGGGVDSAARTGDLATSLGVAPGTMTATVKRLAERGLVAHTPYRGVELTSAGRHLAVSVVRRHRIVERFLSDMLSYSWSEADRLAPAFEHALPPEVEGRLFEALDRPTTCPHGFPIPEPESDALPPMPALYSLNVGDRAVVALPGSTDEAMIDFLDGLGLRPGVEVEIIEKQPFDGPVIVHVVGRDSSLGDVTLGDKVARHILARLTPASADGSVAGSGKAQGGAADPLSKPDTPDSGVGEEQLA